MAMSSPLHAIPGSFISDLSQSDHSILPPKLDVTVGPRSHIFQPPPTPSASSSLLQSSTSATYQTPMFSAGASRKRSRHGDSTDPLCFSASSSRLGWSVDSLPSETSFAASTATSPEPLANTKYRLAGGRNRPCPAIALKQDSIRHAANVDHEPGRTWAVTSNQRPCLDDDYDDYDYPSYSPVRQLRADGHRSKGSSSPANRQSRNGWGRVVFDVVGEVAGRVWQFCRTGAFRGFYAGGGPGYAMRGHEGDENHHSDLQNANDATSDGSTPRASPMPNDDEGDLGGSYLNLEASSPPRPAKRIQREKGQGDPREHWVIVMPKKTPSSNDRRGRSHQASEVGMSGERRGGRKFGMTTLGGRTSASRAGRRSGLNSALSTTGANPNSPNRLSNRPASYASPRGPAPSTTDGLDSPETRRLKAQHQRLERAKDASMQEFNRRLKAMIQEGKQALGTTFTVEELDMDGEVDGDGDQEPIGEMDDD